MTANSQMPKTLHDSTAKKKRQGLNPKYKLDDRQLDFSLSNAEKAIEYAHSAFYTAIRDKKNEPLAKACIKFAVNVRLGVYKLEEEVENASR